MIALGVRSEVEIFPHLDVALGAEDERAPVAPCAEALRIQPVHADVVRRAVVGDEVRLAPVLEFGELLVLIICDRRMNDVSAFRSRVGEELLELMAPEINEDAAAFLAAPKPRRARPRIAAVRPHAHHLHHAANRSLLDELPRADARLDMQPFGKIHGILFPRAPHGRARGVELRERGEGRLVGEVVLARVEHAAAERPAFAGHCRARHKLHVFLREHLVHRAERLRSRIFLAEFFHLRRIRIEDVAALAAGLGEPLTLPEDVAVIECRRCEDKLARLHHRRGFAHGGVVHSV